MKIILPHFLHLKHVFSARQEASDASYAVQAKGKISFRNVFDLKIPFFSIFVAFSLMNSLTIYAQNLRGQWIGSFSSLNESTSSNKTDYIIEIETSGEKITGYSYTYFAIAGKRYYVICRLEGNFDKGSKSLVVSEVETLKTNTPVEFQNCLQSHLLTYLKSSDKESLVGKWKPTKIGSDCGKGLTELERKIIPKANFDKSKNEKILVKKTESSDKKLTPQNNINSSKITESKKSTEVSSSTKVNDEIKNQSNSVSSNATESASNKDPKASGIKQEINKSLLASKDKEKLLVRAKQFIKTIEISGNSFHIDIYDNGQVDGDTVTIFLNDKLLIPAKKLTTTPISLDVKIDDDVDTYDITMFAESLGTIPPNTALMIVNTSTERYEINITSTEQTSGAVRFKVKR